MNKIIKSIGFLSIPALILLVVFVLAGMLLPIVGTQANGPSPSPSPTPTPTPTPMPATAPTPIYTEEGENLGLIVSNLQITPYYSEAGEPVAIRADVENRGSQPVAATINLMVNGYLERALGVNLAPRAAQAVYFTVYRSPPGEYMVVLGNATGTFYVSQGGEVQDTGVVPFDTGGMIAMAVISVIVIGGLVVVFVFGW